MKIILGDDDIDDIELFEEALKEVRPQAELGIARNGQQVLSLLSNFSPAMIFIDINMPEMDGWECLSTIKRSAIWKKIPVVIYTTSSSKRDSDMAKELGVTRLFTKPDRYQDLVGELKEILTEIETK